MRYFLLISSVFALLACDDKGTTPTIDSKINMSNSKANMVVNESRAFVVAFDASNTEKTLTWTVELPNTGGTVKADPNLREIFL